MPPFAADRWHDGKRKLAAGCCSPPAGLPKLARVSAAATNGDVTADVTPRRDVIRCECDVSGGGDQVAEYLSRSRINVNVRQVFPRGLMLKPEDA